MAFTKTIHSDFSGHTMFVSEVDPAKAPAFVYGKGYTQIYTVRNFGVDGVIFMYLGRGRADAPSQIVAWYPKGGFWSSYGTTFKSAIEGAQRDGWLSA